MSSVRPEPMPRRQWWMLAASIGILALAASFNSLWNAYTYDDVYIIRTNEIVHDLTRIWRVFVLPYWPIKLGGDGYRPLTLLVFAIQWTIGSGSPLVFHAVSIAVYIAAAIAAFWLASLLLPTPFAWLTAAFFAVQPVHVESVANVVGQAELWVGVLLLGATALFVEGRLKGALSPRRGLAIALMYLAACLFKEHAVMLPFVLLVAEALIIRSAGVSGSRQNTRFFRSLLALGAVFVVFRFMVIGKKFGGFDPFVPFLTLDVGFIDRGLTMLGIVPHWLRLFFWPATLSAEYGPPHYPVATGPAIWQLPGLLILSGVLALGVATARRAPIVAFGIAWTAITLLPVSNLVVPSGVMLAERTLFTPSFGAILVGCSMLQLARPYLTTSISRTAALAGVGCVIWAGIARSIVQSATWRNNRALFSATVAASPDVYRSHYMMGAVLMGQNQFVAGERSYLRSMALFDRDPFVPYNLAHEYFRAGLYQHAYRMYARAERILPRFQDGQARMALTLAVLGRYREATAMADSALRAGRGDSTILFAIRSAAAFDERARARLLAKLGQPPAVAPR